MPLHNAQESTHQFPLNPCTRCVLLQHNDGGQRSPEGFPPYDRWLQGFPSALYLHTQFFRRSVCFHPWALTDKREDAAAALAGSSRTPAAVSAALSVAAAGAVSAAVVAAGDSKEAGEGKNLFNSFK